MLRERARRGALPTGAAPELQPSVGVGRWEMRPARVAGPPAPRNSNVPKKVWGTHHRREWSVEGLWGHQLGDGAGACGWLLIGWMSWHILQSPLGPVCFLPPLSLSCPLSSPHPSHPSCPLLVLLNYQEQEAGNLHCSHSPQQARPGSASPRVGFPSWDTCPAPPRAASLLNKLGLCLVDQHK